MRYFSDVCALTLLISAGPFSLCGPYAGSSGFPGIWAVPRVDTFHLTYKQGASFEDSQLERVGVWVTAIADSARAIRVLPSEEAERSGLKTDFQLDSDGRLVRRNKGWLKSDLEAKRLCLPELVVAYNGHEPNYEQSLTLRDLASYARIKGKPLTVIGRPLVAWLEPAQPYRGSGLFQPYQFDVEPGISLLPEGVLTITPIARALQQCEVTLGFNIDVTSAIRGREKQSALFNELTGKQDVAAPGHSYHDRDLGGTAIDVDNWQEALPCLEQHNIRHGDPGRGPLYNDPWHFTYRG